MTTTKVESEKRYCRYKGRLCEYATYAGYCTKTACVYRFRDIGVEYSYTTGGTYKGGDTE